MTTYTIYGIKNCNTMKKAFDFLVAHQVAYEFFDYKKQVLSQDDFAKLVHEFGLARVINKQGTTYRKLDDDIKAVLAGEDLEQIYTIVKDQQSMIKRPIVLGDGVSLIGFDESEWRQTFGAD